MTETLPTARRADACADNREVEINLIQKHPVLAPSKPWEKLSEQFSRLKASEQRQFFQLHEDAIVAWLAARK
ncbi:hypothetical protein PSC71_08205 [Devosia sp. J2-20]|uniref:hypothetical protein n=1 Tax=Devosia sp. J2-20 TaxID=3026161 RepID=UPI00249B320E|nr:hypothetical protein [Devosia sp. J2-20]WDR00716.1 hypothetical protein PSC71_08205 [Devosia sp. J2-20]